MLSAAMLRLLLSLAASLLATSATLMLLDSPRALARPFAATLRVYPSGSCPTTLQACIDVSTDGDSVLIGSGTFITSVTLNKAVSLIGTRAVSTTLGALAGQRVITVTGANITSTTVISGLTLANGNASANGGAMQVTGGAQPLLANLVFTNNHSAFNGGAMRADNIGTLVLDNVSFYSNTAGAGFSGGALHASGLNSVRISGGVFQNNSVSGGAGGAVTLFNGGSLWVTGTQFLSNTSLTSHGGAVYVFGSASAVTMTDALLRGNSAASNGGAVYAENRLAAANTQFISNTAVHGGGAYVTGDASLVKDVFQENVVSRTVGWGGGLWVSGSLTLSGTQFYSNSAGFAGGAAAKSGAALNGGIFLNNICRAVLCGGAGLFVTGTASLTATQLISNRSDFDGGGLFATGALTAAGAYFQGNRCTNTCLGGGLATKSSLILSGTDFIANQSLLGGGGASALGTVNVRGGRFEANQCSLAVCRGGGLGTQARMDLTGTLFLSNIAAYGGGVSLFNNTGRIVDAEFAANHANVEGGGLWADHFVTMLLTGTQFISNSAPDGGGLSAATVHSTGDRFERNTATAGGGLLVATTLRLTSTQLLSNSAQSDGGGAYVTNTVIISGALVQNNTSSTGFGGGAFSDNLLIVTNTQFIANAAASSGAGAKAFAARTFASRFADNQAGSSCGGLFALDIGVYDTQFLSNTANFDGGGLCVNAFGELVNSRFENNRALNAGSQGGGARNLGTLNITGTVFISNSAANGGGLWYGNTNQPKNGRIVNSLFARNHATAASGAAEIALENIGATQVLHTTIAGASSDQRAAIGTVSGTLGITDSIIVSHTYSISNSGSTTYIDYVLTFGNFVSLHGGSFQNGGHSLIAEPRFVDRANDDYHLAAGSIALNSGIDVGITRDIDGDTRPQGGGFDIGFDEAPYAVSLALVSSSPTPLGSSTKFTATLTNGQNFDLLWNFGDGSTSIDSYIFQSHTYASLGTYTATITATNALTTLVSSTLVDVAAAQPLTVTKMGTSTGLVLSAPGGINCGSTCAANFVAGTVVTLTASAANNSYFAGWGGACSGTEGCVITMTAPISVTATFNVLNYLYLPLIMR